MSGKRLVLLTNASATGSALRWPGGKGTFSAEGTFGGATVSLQAQLPNGTWANLSTATALTAAGFAVFEAAEGDVRAAVTGGAPSALYANAISH